MKITKEISIEDFEAWSGGRDTLNELTSSECEQLESQLEDLFPDGMDETEVNDILWFERDWVAECLGYRNWEHLERDHAGISDEDHAREIIKGKFPDASDELIDEYIENEWSEDTDDDDVLEEFEDFMNDKNEEDEE